MRSKNWKHRLLSLTMCLALALTLLPAGAAAVEGSTTTAGGIVVSADSADGYSVGNRNYVTINKGGSYTVTDNPDSTEPGAQINVKPTDGKTVYLTLNGVSMKELYISSESAKTDVVLTLEGVNTVSDGIKMADGNCSLQMNLADGSKTTVTGSGTGTAGINVPAGAALTINGDTGVLAANGHGYVGDYAGSYANPGIAAATTSEALPSTAVILQPSLRSCREVEATTLRVPPPSEAERPPQVMRNSSITPAAPSPSTEEPSPPAV